MTRNSRTVRNISPAVLEHLAAELTQYLSGGQVADILEQSEHLFRFIVATSEGLRSLVFSLHRDYPGVFSEETVPRTLKPARHPIFRTLVGSGFVSASPLEAGLSLRFEAEGNETYILVLRLRDRLPCLVLYTGSEVDQLEPLGALPDRTSLQLDQSLLHSPAQTKGTAVTTTFLVCYRQPDQGPPIPLNVHSGSDSCGTELTARHFESANSAVRTFVFHGLHRVRFERLKATLQKELRHRLKKVQKRVANLYTDLEEAQQADRYRQFGDLLLAHATTSPRGTSEVRVPAFDGSGDVVIPLDPTRTPVENAQEHYRRARKLEGKRRIATRRLEEAERETQQLHEILAQTERAETLKALQDIAAQAGIELSTETFGSRPRVRKKQRPGRKHPFLEFTSADGLQILAGRSARDNEQLTFQVAKEHDFWFHVAGTTGSHVIVRNPKRLEKCPPRTAQQAAALAAYLSKNRNSKNVLVHYTQKRYLKKAKGGQPGAVIMKTFQSMFAQPALPDSTESKQR